MKKEECKPTWKVVDVAGQPLGRAATAIATMLMGKDKPTFTRQAATGDFVIVINAEKIKLSGKKLQDKVYKWYTGYSRGLKTINAETLLAKHPERLIKRAVHGMLPRNFVGRKWNKRLRVFVGPEHNHQAQNPQRITLPGQESDRN